MVFCWCHKKVTQIQAVQIFQNSYILNVGDLGHELTVLQSRLRLAELYLRAVEKDLLLRWRRLSSSVLWC